MLLMAAAEHVGCDYKSFTAVSDGLTDDEKHFDIQIAEKIAAALGRENEIVYSSEQTAADAQPLFVACSTMRHFNSQRKASAFLSWEHKERLLLHTWGSEINRRFWDIPDRDDPLLRDVLGCTGYQGNTYARGILEPWFFVLKRIRKEFGYQEMDLVYWESRLGRWASESLSDYNLIQATVSPFSCRSWFELVLASTGSRGSAVKAFYRDMTHYLDPRISDFPLNPFPVSYHLRHLKREFPKMAVRGALKATGQYRRFREWRDR